MTIVRVEVWTLGRPLNDRVATFFPHAVGPAGVDDVVGDPKSEEAREALIPIAEALEGMNVVGLPDDMRWVGAFMLIKTENDHGGGGWSSRRTEGLSDEELLGVLAVHAEMLRDRIRYRSED